MSGVFLYVAIVAIWAFVLVPRWLRRHHAQQQPDAALMEAADSDDQTDAEYDEPYADTVVAEAHASPDADPEPADIEEPPSRPAVATSPAAAASPRRSYLPPSRTRMLRARRRLLTGLMVLAGAVGGSIEARLIPLWACIPPALILAVYLLLLREVGRAETEQARERAAAEARVRAAHAHAARRRAEAEAAAAAQPSAQIIDISARVGDQLYDQYADATVRAVGD